LQGVRRGTIGYGLLFLPAYQDAFTGETRLPLNANGRVSSPHTLYGLPDHRVLIRSARGSPLVLKTNIITGFIHSGRS
jgi:hypothetical protein